MYVVSEKTYMTYKSRGYKLVERLVKWDKDSDEEPTIMSVALTLNGDYIGTSKTAYFLTVKKGLTNLQKIDPDSCVCSLGFNEKEQKWYGWSHRAIYGFGIGSTVKKGDCAYSPATVDELYEELTNRLTEEEKLNYEKLEDGVRERIACYKMHEVKDPKNPDLVAYEPDLSKIVYEYYTYKIGRGEWTATTLDEAKEMAIAFARSVS